MATSVDRAVPVLARLLVLVLAVIVGLFVSSPNNVRISLALGFVLMACVLGMRAPRSVIYALPLWLVALGTVRRLTTGLVNASPTADALLIVGPAAIAALAWLAVHHGALKRPTSLTTAVIILTGLLGISVLNPGQGRLRVGLAGGAMIVAPMLAFLVGRALLTETVLARLLFVVAGLGLPAAAYGLFQTFVRLPSWDQRWVDTSGYIALRVGQSALRPFGSFASGQEFGTFIAIGLVIAVAGARRLRWLWSVPVIGWFATAVWYESARGVLVSLIVAIGLVLCAKGGWPLARALVIGGLLLAALPWAASQAAHDRFGGDPGSQLTAHQVQGLANPFGEGSSLPGHVDSAVGGAIAAFRNPLGIGVGAISGAAGKLGGTSGGTEVDIGNAGVAAGLPGLVAFLAVFCLGMARAYRLAAGRQDFVSVATVGVLTATMMQWLNGGLYSVAWLPWLLLGWVDQQRLHIGRTESKNMADEAERVCG